MVLDLSLILHDFFLRSSTSLDIYTSLLIGITERIDRRVLPSEALESNDSCRVYHQIQYSGAFVAFHQSHEVHRFVDEELRRPCTPGFGVFQHSLATVLKVPRCFIMSYMAQPHAMPCGAEPVRQAERLKMFSS